MGNMHWTLRAATAVGMLLATTASLAFAQETWHFIFPEQRHLEVRDPACLPKARIPDIPPPPTVAAPAQRQDRNLPLDEAIRISLANSEVVRVLAGVTAVASGSTIYDPAVANTQIDQARARFDPTVNLGNTWNQREIPQGVFDPAAPSGVSIGGSRVEDYNMALGVTKPTVTGGRFDVGVNTNPTRSSLPGLPLNPQTPSSVDLAYTQPLLQGAGVRANLAPIVIARIDTERSFFQMKDSVQQMVRGVIAAYWNLVNARTDLWARQQQVEQLGYAFRRARARLEVRMANAAEVAQAEAALAQFEANLIASKADVLQREDALRNILGLPPSDAAQLVPSTPPSSEEHQPDWSHLLRLAETRRPDLIELKLILEADQQQLILAKNQALPRLDASALYRWNGLEGRTPDQTLIRSGPGDFTDWQLGVNFSVPLGLRSARAQLRQRELLIMRDRANLEQGLHSTAHNLATQYRNLAQYYRQYEAYVRSRRAAEVSLRAQFFAFDVGKAQYIDVLQAITNWGNAVSGQSLTLTQYNTELANLETETGTILESHGVRFVEERYGSIGPLGRLFNDRCYPRDMHPGPNRAQYQDSSGPAENVFNLMAPIPSRQAPGAPPQPAPRPNGQLPPGLVPRPAEPIPAPLPQL